MEQCRHDHIALSPPFSYRTRCAKHVIDIRLARTAVHSRMLFLSKVVSALDAVLIPHFVILAVNVHDIAKFNFQFICHGCLLSAPGALYSDVFTEAALMA